MVMISKAIGLMIFAAGFAAGALLFLNKADLPQAQAQMRVQEADIEFSCTLLSPIYRRSHGLEDELPKRFAVDYDIPPCLSIGEYRAVNAWLIDQQYFCVAYEKVVY
jgi:hypothetical protein